MSAVMSSVFGAGAQLFTNQGVILAGGKLSTYLAGSTAAQATWTSSAQTTQNANPIILDSAGRIPNEIWLASGFTYKFVLSDSTNTVLGTWDNIPGINQTPGVLSEWLTGYTSTYINATTFTTSGNTTGSYQVARRVQYVLYSGQFTGTVVSSTFDGATTTTVVITPDSTSLDNTLSIVNYGFMSSINNSVPVIFAALNNPTFTGIVTIPAGASISGYATLASPTFTGTVGLPSGTTLDAPVITGNGVAVTQTAGNNSTRIATTAFVTAAAFNTALPSQGGNAGKFVSTNGSTAAWTALPAAAFSMNYSLYGAM